MSKFLSNRDIKFFKSINRELIDKIIETDVILYKTIIKDSNVDDIYGESVDRKFYSGVKFNCLIYLDDIKSEQTDFGQDRNRPIKIAVNRDIFKNYNIIPENGDILEWNNMFWEIYNVNENQYLGGRKLLSWSYICDAHLTNLSYINIEERIL